MRTEYRPVERNQSRFGVHHEKDSRLQLTHGLGRLGIRRSAHSRGGTVVVGESMPTSMMDDGQLETSGEVGNKTQDGKWIVMYRETVTYQAKHGHCNVPRSQGSLGAWVNKQRQAHRKDKLTEVRAKLLDDIGFEWSLRRRRTLETWDERYERLKEYKTMHGNCTVPQSSGPFGEWVNNQRRMRKKGKLSEERARKLDKLGFEWSLKSPPRKWDERLDELSKYQAEHGHCNVPRSQGSLGAWVKNQRSGKEKLPKERKKRLDDLGFEWNPRGTSTTWDERLDELTKYKAENGHCNVHQKSQGSLGEWVNNQRRARKKDKLSTERIQKLEDLGFVWSLQNPQGTPPTNRQVQCKWPAGRNRVKETGSTSSSLDSSLPPKSGERGINRSLAIGGELASDSTNSSPSTRARGSSNNTSYDIRPQHDLNDKVETLTAELSKARSQLDRLKQQYDGAMSMVETLNAQNASLVEQIAVAKQSLGANAAELKSVSQQLKNAVVQLESLKST